MQDMHVALLSDIHGNLLALEAVLTDLKTAKVDQLICLGDVVEGPQSRETLRRVKALGCKVVMGNMDAALLGPRTLETVSRLDENTERFLAIEQWSAAQLSEDDRAFMRSFAQTVRLELDNGQSLLACHGSLRSYDEAIMATTSVETLAMMLAGHDVSVVACGHAHAPLLRRYYHTLIVNPGSIGAPFVSEVGGPWRHPHYAEYALIDTHNDELNVFFRRVPYDVGAYLEAVRASTMPHIEWYLQGYST